MKQGCFIVIEGLEGAGKTTAIQTVQQWLQEQGHPLVQTREPGGTPLAEQIRTLVKSAQQERVSPVTELLLMYAARAQLLDNVIRPALERGDWVLADRHDLSSRAYQGGGRQIPDEVLDPIRQLVLADLRPDLTLYLDIDPVIGLERARARGELDRIEQEQLGFFQRARAKYLAIASSEPNIVVIDAAKPLADVQQQLRQALEQHFA
jgi:dTMP kinase